MPESSEGDGAVPARAASLKRPCGCVPSPITRETAHLIREDPCLRKAVEADLAGVPRPDPLCPDATCPHHAPAGPDAIRRGWAWTKKLCEPRRPRRYLTKSEIALLIQNCEERFKPLLLAMVYTGVRKSELTALRWRDLNFEGGKIALFRPKVGNSDYIDLHPAPAAELKRVRESRKGKDRQGAARRTARVGAAPSLGEDRSWTSVPSCDQMVT